MGRSLLFQIAAETFFIQATTTAAPLNGLLRTAGNIGLSSLAGGHDFGLLIAHNLYSFLFFVVLLVTAFRLSCNTVASGIDASLR